MIDLTVPEIALMNRVLREAALLARAIQEESAAFNLTKDDRSPVTVAAPRVPPKSIDAVPDSMPCTPKIHMQQKPIMKAASPGTRAAPRISSEMIWPM